MARLPIRSIACAAAILGPVLALCSLAAAQQTPPAEGPAAPRTEPAPGTAPTRPPAVKPSEAPISGTESLVGLDVFSSDGTRVGEVRAVSTGPGGDVVALHVRTGGFLGFGGRTVAVPQGRFSRTGQSVRLDLNSDQISGLPDVKE
jgi:sporulation protein YlmC with PRC-barrel domain